MAAGYDREGGYSFDDTYDEQQQNQQQNRDESPDFVPDFVKSFVGYLYRSIREKNVYEVHKMYEGSFANVTERFYSKSHWPSAELVAPYVDNDHVFCLLYKEMYFRHVYAKLSVTFQERLESWDNYCNLFTVILHGNVNMQLPNQWLWDMVDEFIYQFQSFCQYRTKLKNKSEQELTWLRQYDEQVWNVYGVMNYLQALVDKSEILQTLADEEASANFSATEGYDYEGGSNVLKVLGYFSIIGLARVHCLLGDYHTTLKRLSPIDLTQHGVYSSIIGCHITTAYYFGFSNMMLRRYIDAIKTFNQILMYISKAKHYHAAKPALYSWLLNKNEQMYALLAICLWFCPQPQLLEAENARGEAQKNETVSHLLREKRGEKMVKMQKNDEAAFDECFCYGCPKFISPALPDLNDAANFSQDAYRLQLKLFLSEVRQQQLLNKIRNVVKLYTTISIPKLASFVEVDEATLRMSLMTYKHKTTYLDDDGSLATTADVEFYLDEDEVHIAEPKVTKRFGEIFVRHILKFDEVIGDLERVSFE